MQTYVCILRMYVMNVYVYAGPSVCMYVCRSCPCALHKGICESIQMHSFLTLALYVVEWSALLPSCFIPGILWGEKNLVSVKNPRPSEPVVYTLIDCAALVCMFLCGFLSAYFDQACVCFCVHLYMDYKLSLRKREQFNHIYSLS